MDLNVNGKQAPSARSFAAVAVLMLLAYAWIPSVLARTVLLLTLALLFLCYAPTAYRPFMGLLALGAMYAFAFLVHPVATFLADLGVADPQVSPPLYSAGLIFLGMAWIALIVRQFAPFARRTHSPAPDIKALAVLIPCFVLIFLPASFADLTYGGDELYHVTTIAFCQEELHLFARSALGAVLAGAWILGAVACGYSFAKTPSIRAKAILVCAILGTMFVIAAIASTHIITPSPENATLRWERISRYPIGQSWLSALLMAGTREAWQPFTFYALGMPYYRLLPMLFLFHLGWYMMVRFAPVGLLEQCLTVMAMLTIPLCHYFATLVYLDMAVITLTTVVLLDFERISAVPPEELLAEHSGWCLFLLAFTKETALPVLAMLLGLRLLRRVIAAARTRLSVLVAISGESMVAFTISLPLSMYLGLRSLQNLRRPYAGDISGLLQPELLGKAMMSVVQQSGVIVLLALVGAVILWQRRRLYDLCACVAMLCGMKLFFMMDSQEYLTLNRFNFYTVPAIIALSWRALQDFAPRRTTLILSAALVLVANLGMSPVSVGGERRAWRDSGESWFPYREACEYARRHTQAGPILFGNQTQYYGCEILFQQMGWTPPPAAEQIAFRQYDREEAVKATLYHANKNSYPVVFYRYDRPLPYPVGARFGRHILSAKLHCADGGILVFVDETSAPRER